MWSISATCNAVTLLPSEGPSGYARILCQLLCKVHNILIVKSFHYYLLKFLLIFQEKT